MNIGAYNNVNYAMRNGINETNRSLVKRKFPEQNFGAVSSDAVTFKLKLGGLVSHGLLDGSNVTVYKAESYTKESPFLRVVTTLADGTQSEQIIDPQKIDVSNATETEMMALNAYLIDEGKLEDDPCISGIFSYTGVSDVRKDFVDIAKELMIMQYRANNLEGYTAYNKLLSVYESLEKN